MPHTSRKFWKNTNQLPALTPDFLHFQYFTPWKPVLWPLNIRQTSKPVHNLISAWRFTQNSALFRYCFILKFSPFFWVNNRYFTYFLHAIFRPSILIFFLNASSIFSNGYQSVTISETGIPISNCSANHLNGTRIILRCICISSQPW
mgnify:CR=1 FL=1